MNILFVTDSTKLSGGIKQLYLNMMGLHQRGHNIHLACKEGAATDTLKHGEQWTTTTVSFKSMVRQARTLATYCRSNRIEVIHTFHSKGHKLGVLTKVFNRDVRLFINRGVSFYPHNPLFSLFPGINGWITNSHSVARILRTVGVSRRKINIVYNAMESDDHVFHHETMLDTYRDKPGRVNIVCVTSHGKWKDNGTLMETFDLLSSDERFSFYLIGIEPQNSFLRLISHIPEDRIHFLGLQRNIPGLLKEMDLFAYTPLGGDSCPNVILEAFAAGLPVVSTKVGGIPELVLDGINGYTTKRKNPAEIAMAIRRIANDGPLREHMAENNRKRFLLFNSERKIDALLRVYQGEHVVQSLDQ